MRMPWLMAISRMQMEPDASASHRPCEKMGMISRASENVETIEAVRPTSTRTASWLLFLGAVALYSLSSYAGIRSPDSEVMFETSEALVANHSFAVSPKASWTGFGLAPGKDGRIYSIFGPLQAVLATPLVAAADAAAERGYFAGWVSHPSLPYGNGLAIALRRAPAQDFLAHARRAAVAWAFNSLVTAVGVTVLFWITLALGCRVRASLATAALYGAGSLAWPYAGTFFSEPLATTFVLLSLWRLLAIKAAGPRVQWIPLVSSGFLLGLAITTHITAVLFVPFWCWLAIGAGSWRVRWRPLLAWLGGLTPPLALLGAYNNARFGHLLETGRTALPGLALQFGYGVWQAPWQGLHGLLLGAGKGLFLFCPAVLIGLWAWPVFYRRHHRLALALAGAFILRWIFIACRSDWHGGFSLGPRQLVMIVPFLILPCAVWLEAALAVGDRRRSVIFVVAGLAASMEQLLFVVGEIIAFFHIMALGAADSNIHIFGPEYRIYLDWDYSPLLFLLRGPRGPYLLENIHLSNPMLWAILSALAAVAWIVMGIALIKGSNTPKVPPLPSASGRT
jgi:hypothetical protein